MMFFSRSFSAWHFTSRVALVGVGALSLVATSAGLAQRSRYLPSAVTQHGASMGLESPGTPISATVWLGMRDKPAFDAAVQALYTPGSPTYHQWMTAADLKRFQPTAAEAAAVKAELSAHHLSIVSVDPANYSIKFTGQAENFESAFHTQLNRYKVGSQMMRVALAEPALTGGATGLVRSVTGFSGRPLLPHTAFPHDVKSGKQIGIKPVTSLKPQGAIFSSQCLYPVTTVSLSSPGTATYTGFGYGANPNNTTAGTISPCGYSPQDVYGLYNLSAVYNLGINGAGQTIVIVDAYGSPTIQADAAAFSSVYSLPAPTATSLKVYTPNPVTGSDAGWAGETTLDVEWSHAIAPAANIALIAAPSAQDDDLQTSLMYAVTNHLGNVISNSYGQPESYTSGADMDTWEQISALAAAQGISIQFSTGDNGDFSYSIGYADVSVPSNSPHATAVGGTSVAFSPLDGSTITTGWGTNITELSPGDNSVDNPPVPYGFQFGAGGGESSYFAKAAYQSQLPGTGRQQPDVSAIADPYTGVEIIITVDGGQYFEAIGGTSLAAPVFSAMWAMVDEYYGIALGQAAPYIAQGSPLVADVTGPNMGANTSGSVTENNVTTHYSGADLAEPLENTTDFAAGIWNFGGGTYYNITFGTDTSLTVTPGWDNVTGYGTPSFAVLGTTMQAKR